ncbi:MAG TPA: hypothetical protein VKV37_07820 [Ktedonobacteraceae bacterium]|nr:hypothetical protein [Ktedonobacteraceae bacterium]
MTEPESFRQRLDAVLRTMDVQQVRDFLIAEHQWSEEAPADPETAMWMMIAGAATLRDLHGRAREWLVQHGHGQEAEAILGKRGQQNPGGRKGKRDRQQQSKAKKGAR